MAGFTKEARGGIAWGWALVWVAFVGYAILGAPPDDPALTRTLLSGMFTGHLGGVDPAIAAVFMLLGVVPALASSFVLRDGATRRLPAWPFVLGMFLLGAMALLPYLALRRVGGPRPSLRRAGAVRQGLARPWLRWGILVAIVVIGSWGLTAGSAAAYARAFRSASLVNVMTLDLVVCTALLFVLVEEARRANDLAELPLARAARAVPLLGAALWNALVKRPP